MNSKIEKKLSDFFCKYFGNVVTSTSSTSFDVSNGALELSDIKELLKICKKHNITFELYGTQDEYITFNFTKKQSK